MKGRERERKRSRWGSCIIHANHYFSLKDIQRMRRRAFARTLLQTHALSVLWAAATRLIMYCSIAVWWTGLYLFIFERLWTHTWTFFYRSTASGCSHKTLFVYSCNQTHNTKREVSCMLCLSPFDDESICRSMCPTGLCLIMNECCKLHTDPCCDIQNIYQQT